MSKVWPRSNKQCPLSPYLQRYPWTPEGMQGFLDKLRQIDEETREDSAEYNQDQDKVVSTRLASL